jgi:hypothetical protein
MAETHSELEAVVELVKQLSPIDKVRLLERVIPDLEAAIGGTERKPLRFSYGALADLGSAPSAEDIDQVRREMWRGFPREDV